MRPTPRARIVHISADFPDPLEPAKTSVIRDYVELTRGRFDHHVVSINRIAPKLSRGAGPVPFAYGEALEYRAPSYGIGHRTMLERLGKQLARDIAARGKPDLLVAHKLTVEGLAVAVAAHLLDCPFALTIQGNTDTKILAARPDLRPRIRHIFHAASHVVTFAPWALQAVEAMLGKRSGPCAVVPCPTSLDRMIAPRAGTGLVSLFHLRNADIKNLAKLAEVHRTLVRSENAIPLAIVGGGRGRDMVRARKLAGSGSAITFEGELPQEAVPARLNSASGMVMPSKRESFGLAFIEALFAGCPIIYPRGRAVAGHFDGRGFAIPVDPDNSDDIAAAMVRIVDREHDLKSELAAWQASEHAQRFTRSSIARAYGDALEQALGAAEQ